MTEASLVQITVALLSSGGIIGAIISVLVFASGRMDKRKERTDKQIHDTSTHDVDLKRVELDKDKSVSETLWKIIDEKNDEIKDLKTENFAISNESSLSRPRITKIYQAVRSMRKEVDAINGSLGNDTANPNVKRFSDIRRLLDEIEVLLP